MNDYHNHHASRQIGVRQILVGLTIAIAALARPEQADAQEPCVIDFNAEASLRSIRFGQVKAGSDTFVPKYSSQCSVTVISGVEPPDPRLGGSRPNHFHLSYENNFSYQLCSVGSGFNNKLFLGAVVDGICQPFVDAATEPSCNVPEAPQSLARELNGVCVRVIDAAKEPRTVQPHSPNAVVQLTYDRDGNGTPDPFGLQGIDVLGDSLNVGIMFESGEIGVFNNLTAGVRWVLVGAERVVRATLECASVGGPCTSGIWKVDNIAIVPLQQ